MRGEEIWVVVVLMVFCGAHVHVAWRTWLHVHARPHIHADPHGCDCSLHLRGHDGLLSRSDSERRTCRMKVLRLCEQERHAINTLRPHHQARP